MKEYIGKINISKDTMLFVLNDIFEQGISQNTTKENILKMIPEIYSEENLPDLIKMLPYDSYLTLEKLFKYLKRSNDINKFTRQVDYKGIHYLEEAMIIIMRARYSEYNYSINPGVLEKLDVLFNEKNRKLAEKYGEIEKLTQGLLYTYGIVEFNFLRTTICRYIGKIVSEEELYDLYFKRLNLNTFVKYYNIVWTNTNQKERFATYLDEEIVDLGKIACHQKNLGLEYKMCSKKYILQREEFLWDEKANKLFEFVRLRADYMFKIVFQNIQKKSEIGEDIFKELLFKCKLRNEKEIEEFMKLFMDWYNNSSQYPLCGYSPIELVNKIKR